MGKRGSVDLHDDRIILTVLLPLLEITDQVRDFSFEGVTHVAGSINCANIRMIVALRILKTLFVPEHELFVPRSVMHGKGINHRHYRRQRGWPPC